MRVGLDGKVFIVSTGYDGSNHEFISISDDGCDNFYEFTIADILFYPGLTGYPGLGNYPGLKGTRGFKAYPYSAFDLDPSNNTLYDVFASYDDANNVAAQFVTRSDDEGQHWSSPQQ